MHVKIRSCEFINDTKCHMRDIAGDEVAFHECSGGQWRTHVGKFCLRIHRKANARSIATAGGDHLCSTSGAI